MNEMVIIIVHHKLYVLYRLTISIFCVNILNDIFDIFNLFALNLTS